MFLFNEMNQMKELDTEEMDSKERELYEMLRSKFSQEEMKKLAKLMIVNAEKYHQEKLNNNIALDLVSKRYATATETIENIKEGVKYELIEKSGDSCYIIDETGHKEYYSNLLFNVC